MTRIPGVPAREAGLYTRLAYFFSRRGMARLTGREVAGGIEPIEVLANSPAVLKAVGRHEQALAKLDGLDRRHRALAELKAAQVVECEYCIDLGSQVSRQWGLSDEELLGLATYRTAPCFSAVDRLVLDHAVAMSRTPTEVSDELFAALQEHFDAAQLVELTYVIAVGNLRGRLNRALGIGAAGFSEGRVCALPASRVAA